MPATPKFVYKWDRPIQIFGNPDINKPTLHVPIAPLYAKLTQKNADAATTTTAQQQQQRSPRFK
jgi:hypothetical protein